MPTTPCLTIYQSNETDLRFVLSLIESSNSADSLEMAFDPNSVFYESLKQMDEERDMRISPERKIGKLLHAASEMARSMSSHKMKVTYDQLTFRSYWA
jgi:hypothetical protein